MTGDRRRALGLPVVAALLCSFVLLAQADIALHKGFWLDEGFEIVRTCGQSLAGMLKDGAYECSPAPLYWLAQTAVIRSVDAVSLSLRLQYRAISLGASALTVLVLLLGIGRRLGLLAALVAFSALAVDAGFHHYATQNRAYMTWAMATTVLVFCAAAAAVASGLRPSWLTALLGAGLLVSLAALPGGLQALSAFAACVLIRRRLGASPPDERRVVMALALGGLVLLALDVHYWAGSPCRGYTAAGDLDIAVSGDRWSLVRRALTVLWPEADSLRVILADVALVAGAFAPVALWRRRAALTDAERSALVLSVVALSQLLPALPVALGLALGRYLFLPRMFVFVMVPRAVLIGVGFWLIASSAQRRARGSGRLVGAATAGVAFVLTLLGMAFTVQWARSLRFPLPPVGEVSCAALAAPELYVLERPQVRGYAFTPNFLVRVGRALDACGSAPAPAGGGRYLLALDATNQADWFRVADAPPPGFEPMQVCQAPVVLRHGRRGR